MREVFENAEVTPLTGVRRGLCGFASITKVPELEMWRFRLLYLIW